MENYFNTKNKRLCNGCGTCSLKCPTQAITMKEDKEGFLYPVIDEEKCIKCGLCERVCSNYNDNQENAKAYIAINKNTDELNISSSGGMFYILARYVTENNGVVFGVAYDENLKAEHRYAETLEECKKFCGSKYVRSDLKDTYKETKDFLDIGRIVLYTGTACQINGLKKFLGKNYDNLILCDILCHANPSPKVFELYKKNLEAIYNKKIIDIKFRGKENGWKNQTPIIIFEDKIQIEEDSYFNAFVNEMISRPSCYSCVFANKNRVTDFTIADFWGIEKVKPELDRSKGVSLITINSEKGDIILEKLKNKMYIEEVNVDTAAQYNHFQNVPEHKNRDKFFKGIANEKINKNNVIKYMNKYTKSSFIKRILRKSKNILKRIIRK